MVVYTVEISLKETELLLPCNNNTMFLNLSLLNIHFN